MAMRWLRCLFRHDWELTGVDGPADVGHGFARMFGNSIVEETCRRCGKVKRRPAVYMDFLRSRLRNPTEDELASARARLSDKPLSAAERERFLELGRERGWQTD